jgi:hypothetical protein
VVFYLILIKAQGSRLKAQGSRLSLSKEKLLLKMMGSLYLVLKPQVLSLTLSLSTSLDLCACLETLFGHLVDTHVSLVL